MSNFKHFLITRINVDWNISRPCDDRNSVEFLNHRFNLFEEICYPSVIAQDNKNFTWLILLDSELPSQFKERVNQYNSPIKLIPIYVENRNTLLQSVREAIVDNTGEGYEHLITTNIDSDDAVTSDFVTLIQNYFNSQDFEFINFPFGYLYRFDNQELYLREWLTSPFYTLVEGFNNFKTVLQYEHIEIKNYRNRQIVTKPMWLMTAHGKNVRTNFDVSAAWQPLYRMGSNFPASLDLPSKSSLEYVKETYFALDQVCKSRKQWDTGNVKLRKIINILWPSLFRFFRKIKYSSNSSSS